MHLFGGATGRWMPLFRPRMKQRTALLGQLKVVFGSLKSQPVREVISKINPILLGWVNYLSVTPFSAFRLFATGSSRRFGVLGQSPTASRLRLEAMESAVVV